MEVILLADVEKLGTRGDVVRVTPGFARNFLFPRKLAASATPGAKRSLQEEDKVLAKRDLKKRAGAEELAKKMQDFSCTFSVKADEEDKLYGSVSTADIAKALEEQGHRVDKKQIHLDEDEPIKMLGVYSGRIELHREVQVPIKVWVVRE